MTEELTKQIKESTKRVKELDAKVIKDARFQKDSGSDWLKAVAKSERDNLRRLRRELGNA